MISDGLKLCEPAQRPSILFGESTLIAGVPLFLQESSQHVLNAGFGNTQAWLAAAALGGIFQRIEHSHTLRPALALVSSLSPVMIHDTASAITEVAEKSHYASLPDHLLGDALHHATPALSTAVVFVGFIPIGLDIYACFTDVIPHTLTQGLMRIGDGLATIAASLFLVPTFAGAAGAAIQGVIEISIGVVTMVRHFTDPYLHWAKMNLHAFVNQLEVVCVIAAVVSLAMSLARRESIMRATKNLFSSMAAAAAAKVVFSAVTAAGAVSSVGFVAAVLAGGLTRVVFKRLFDLLLPDEVVTPERETPGSFIGIPPTLLGEDLLVLNPLAEAQVIRVPPVLI